MGEGRFQDTPLYTERAWNALGSAPLNATLIDSVTAAQGNFTTDWWWKRSSSGMETPTRPSDNMPENYTPVVCVRDSSVYMSQASGRVSVMASNTATPPSSGIIVPLFTNDVFAIHATASLRDAYRPS